MTDEEPTGSQWTVITVLVVAIAVSTPILVIALVIVSVVPVVPVVKQVVENRRQEAAEFAPWEAEFYEEEATDQASLLREVDAYRVQIVDKAMEDRDFDTYAEARQFVVDTFAEDIAADPDKWAWEGKCDVEGGVTMFGNVAARPIKPSATITHLRVMEPTEPPGPAEPSPAPEGLLNDQLDWIDSL